MGAMALIYLCISVGAMDGLWGGAHITYLCMYLCGAYGWLVGGTGHVFMYLSLWSLWDLCLLQVARMSLLRSRLYRRGEGPPRSPQKGSAAELSLFLSDLRRPSL